MQTIKGDGETSLRIAVNDDYDSMIFVGYESSITSIRVLKDDTITIKGMSAGLYTYQSTLGGNISVLGILVQQIDVCG